MSFVLVIAITLLALAPPVFGYLYAEKLVAWVSKK